MFSLTSLDLGWLTESHIVGIHEGETLFPLEEEVLAGGGEFTCGTLSAKYSNVSLVIKRGRILFSCSQKLVYSLALFLLCRERNRSCIVGPVFT